MQYLIFWYERTHGYTKFYDFGGDGQNATIAHWKIDAFFMNMRSPPLIYVKIIEYRHFD